MQATSRYFLISSLLGLFMAASASGAPITVGRITPHSSVFGEIGLEQGLFYPTSVDVDRNGSLYVADSANHTIRRIDAAGEMTTLAGSMGQPGSRDGRGTDSRFRNPSALALDAFGNVYVSDSGNGTIRKVSSDGDVTTIAGVAGEQVPRDGALNEARFSTPLGIDVDFMGNIYVADGPAHTIRRIAPNGEVETLAGRSGYPGHADGFANDARFSYPYGIDLDPAGNLWVADSGNHAIRMVTADGFVSSPLGRKLVSGSTDGDWSDATFNRPSDIAFDPNGNLFVTDTGNHTVRKVTREGEVSTVAGLAGQPGSLDGVGSAVRFYAPIGIAIDREGRLYIADMMNHAVRIGTEAGISSSRRRGARR